MCGKGCFFTDFCLGPRALLFCTSNVATLGAESVSVGRVLRHGIFGIRNGFVPGVSLAFRTEDAACTLWGGYPLAVRAAPANVLSTALDVAQYFSDGQPLSLVCSRYQGVH